MKNNDSYNKNIIVYVLFMKSVWKKCRYMFFFCLLRNHVQSGFRGCFRALSIVNSFIYIVVTFYSFILLHLLTLIALCIKMFAFWINWLSHELLKLLFLSVVLLPKKMNIFTTFWKKIMLYGLVYEVAKWC
jgi:hypothetical protein